MTEGIALNSRRHFCWGLGSYYFPGNRFPECLNSNTEKISASLKEWEVYPSAETSLSSKDESVLPCALHLSQPLKGSEFRRDGHLCERPDDGSS